MTLHILTDAISKVLKKLNFLEIFFVLGFYTGFAVMVLFFEPFDEPYEVFFDFILFLAGLEVETLQILLDHSSIFSKELNFIVELGELIEYTVFIFLVDPAQVDD